MIHDKDSALKVAEFLLQIKAVKLDPSNEYTWASGWKSPIYCDNRIILSYPRIRTFVRQKLCEAILEKYGKPEAIAGVATGGIAHGVLVAQELDARFIYVRSSQKKHGLNNQIEGDFDSKQNIVVIEDLVSTGGSSLDAVEALKNAGANVLGMAAIFSYGFELAVDNFAKADCDLVTLADYEILVERALQENYITNGDLGSLLKWRLNPSGWKNNGSQ